MEELQFLLIGMALRYRISEFSAWETVSECVTHELQKYEKWPFFDK